MPAGCQGHSFAQKELRDNANTRICFLLVVALISISPASAALVNTRTIDLGSGPHFVQPQRLVVSPTTHKVYVLNSDTTLSILNGSLGSLASITTLEVAPQPFDFSIALGINTATNRVYVANFGNSSTLAVIDGGTDTLTTVIPLPNYPSTLAVNSVTNKIYLTSGSTLLVVDGSLNSVTAQIPLGSLSTILAIDETRNRVYLATLDGHLLAFDGASQTTAPLGSSVYASITDATLVPSTNTLYVSAFTTCPGPSACATFIAAINASTGAVITTVAPGIQPDNQYSLAANTSNGTVYISSFDTTVYGLSSSTNTITGSTSVTGPGRLTVDPSTGVIYVLTSFYQLVVISPGAGGSLSVVGTLQPSNPFKIASNEITNRIYVLSRDSTVTVVDGASDTIVTTISLPFGNPAPSGIVTNTATNRVYVALGNSIVVIDGVTNQILLTIPIAASAIGVNPSSNRIFAVASSSVQVIDGSNNTTVATITLPSGFQPLDITVNSSNNRIYVSGNTSVGPLTIAGSVVVIDGANDAVVATVPIGGEATGVAVNPITNKVYVISRFNNPPVQNSIDVVRVIDGQTNSEIGVITCIDSVGGIAIDNAGGKLYTTDFYRYVDDVNLSTMNTGCLSVEGRAGVGGNPEGVAVNQATGKVYVANSASGTISVLENILAAPSSVSFVSIDGSVPAAQTVSLSAPDALQFKATAIAYPSSWLMAIPAAGTLPATLTLSANPAGVPAGSQSGGVLGAIVGPGVRGDSTGFSFPATLNIESNLSVAPQTLSFLAVTGSIAPSQTLTVSSLVPIAISASSTVSTPAGGSWINVAVASPGTTPTVVTVSANASGLAQGTYSGSISITSSASANGPQVIPVTLTVTGALLVTTASLPNGVVNATYPATTLQALGGKTPFSWLATGLPPGLAISTDGLLTGIPTAAGTFTPIIKVADKSVPPQTAQKTFSLTIGFPSLSVSAPCPAPAGTQGILYLYPITVSGGNGTYQLSLAGPSWLSLVAPFGTAVAGSFVTALNGIPPLPGVYPFSVLVRDTAGSIPVTFSCAITINPPPVLITSGCPASTLTIGTPFSQSLSATGGIGTYSWSVISGSLPAGLSLIGNAISGTPTGSPGTSTFTIQVSSGGRTATLSCSLTVAPPPLQLTSACPGNGTLGGAYGPFTLGATGGLGAGTYTFSIQGTLPPGVTLSGNTIGGTPTTSGAYSFSVSVTSGTQTITGPACSITIALPLLQITSSCPPASLNLPVTLSVPLTASGGQSPYSWSLSGPSWLGLSSSAGSTTTVTAGTPTYGPFSFTVTLMDSANSAPASFSCNSSINAPVIPPITIVITPPPTPLQPVVIAPQLPTPAPLLLTGVMQLSFIPNAFGITDNPQVYFDGGARTASFTIAAGQTSFSLPNIQEGTVAGTIHLEVINLMQGTNDVLPVPHPFADLVVPRLAPAIGLSDITFANETPNGFDIVISGYSTPRDMMKVILSFAASQGAGIDGTASYTIDVSGLFAQYYSSPASQLAGSMWQNLHIPITVAGDKTAIGSVSVTLTNSAGNSQTITKTR
jgi:DNA-binding beta-propeller fold protein YncE